MHTIVLTVEVEEEVYRYTPANNGAGPMWTQGNTCIVRHGDDLLASGIETLSEYRPLNNVCWTLFHRGSDGWALWARGDGTHEREPCPLVVFPHGLALLSVNPNAARPDEFDSVATPQVLAFTTSSPVPAQMLTPLWDHPHPFHAHTYRSFTADAARRECFLMYSSAYDRLDWTFRDADGAWSKQGILTFPWGSEYEEPQPIRVCYPSVALKERAVYCCGVSDIIEPRRAWRERKREITGQEWDYDFRRLFFTWSDNIESGQFHNWIEIASREETCGWITPCDLYVAPDGDIHLLWHEQAIDERLREDFFPEARQSIALNHAVVRRGQVIARHTILVWHEGDPSSERPGKGRFHATPDGRLLVIYYVDDIGSSGENRMVEISVDRLIGNAVCIPLTVPIPWFYTTTPRAGCAPSAFIDLFGDVGGVMHYAQIRLESAHMLTI